MPFPMPEYQQEVRRHEVVVYKREKLDHLLADIIKNRMIANELSLDPDDHEHKIGELLGLIDRQIDPFLIKVIFSDNPLFGHDVSVDNRYRLFLQTDDRITKALGDVIRYAYEGDIPGEIVDKKRTGCRNVLLGLVHDFGFGAAMVDMGLLKVNPVKRRTDSSFGLRLKRIFEAR